MNELFLLVLPRATHYEMSAVEDNRKSDNPTGENSLWLCKLKSKRATYYRRIQPISLIVHWLNYGDLSKGIFQRRELAFVQENGIFQRHLSFSTRDAMKNLICTLNPCAINLGAVYEKPPIEQKKYVSHVHHKASDGLCRSGVETTNKITQRELVFDIDLTDYDNVRTCCSGTMVCWLCWKFIAVACDIIADFLERNYQFKHLLWVFSGRRGIHCWVCDERARMMNDDERAWVVNQIYVETCISRKKSNQFDEKQPQADILGGVCVQMFMAIIAPRFEEIILDDQNLFMRPINEVAVGDTISADPGRLIDMLPCAEARQQVRSLFDHRVCENSRQIWRLFTGFVAQRQAQNCPLWSSARLKNIITELQLGMLGPRLDTNVTRTRKHLLKLPFSMHQTTFNLCAPIRFESIGTFNPKTMSLSLVSIIDEMEAVDRLAAVVGTENERFKTAYTNTKIYDSVRIFKDFLDKMEQENLNITN